MAGKHGSPGERHPGHETHRSIVTGMTEVLSALSNIQATTYFRGRKQCLRARMRVSTGDFRVFRTRGRLTSSARADFPKTDGSTGKCSRPIFGCAFGRYGSFRVNRVPALTGGSSIRIGPSLLDGCPALNSGRSIKSRQCRRPASSRLSPSLFNLRGSSH